MDTDQFEERDKLYEAISQAGPVKPEDIPELKALMKNRVLQRALCELLTESDAQSAILLGLNLEDPQQRSEGAKAQGRAFGLIRAVEALIDHALTDIKEDK